MTETLNNQVHNEDPTAAGPDWSILSDSDQRAPEVPEFGGYTVEDTRHYVEDKFFDNIAELRRDKVDPLFIETYKNIMTEYPQLRMVTISNYGMQGSAWFKPNGSDSFGTFTPEVACDMSWPETYSFMTDEDLENLEQHGDRLGRGYFIKRLAFALGADWRKCAKNVRLNADATLLHEFGHAHDFIENYLRPEYEKCTGDTRGPEALYRAVRLESANRLEFQRRGPKANGEWIARGSDEWRQNERRLRAMGINNYEEYVRAVHQHYRDMPDEAYADKFAYDYILKHRDDYFTTDPGERSGRILIDPSREIELDADFVHMFGLKQGLGVEIDRLDADRRSVKHISGFLAMNMYVGKSLYLYENGDPAHPGEKWRICRGIADLRMKPVLDEASGEMHHYIFFKDENGVEYHISRSGEEAPLVDGSPQEMAQDLGIEVGDPVQLLPHLRADARELGPDKIGKANPTIINAVVADVSGEEPSDRAAFSFEPDPDTESTLYDHVSRRWKTWYIGEYEILPLPKESSPESTQAALGSTALQNMS